MPVPARREDPRLANRNRPSHSRVAEKPSEPPRKAAESQNPSESGKGSVAESVDKFVSPLDSLYSNNARVSQTGRGYGVQNYRIPKKTQNVADKARATEESVSSVTTAPAVIDSEAVKSPAPRDELLEETEGEPKDDPLQKPEQDDDLPSIPLNVLESYIKKALPSDDAEKVLEKMRLLDRTKGADDSSCKEATSIMNDGSANKTATRASIVSSDSEFEATQRDESSGADATVTSSGDALFIHEEASEAEKSDVSEVVQHETPKQEEQEATVSPKADAETASNQQPTPVPKKRGRKKNNLLMMEVARLQEDVTDFMKNVGDLGSRRNRSRSQPQSAAIELTETLSIDSETDKEQTPSQTSSQAKVVNRRGKRKRQNSKPTG